jgi:hypothetical protein
MTQPFLIKISRIYVTVRTLSTISINGNALGTALAFGY